MADEAVILGLVERIYAAAYDPARWRDYALALSEATGATSAHFLVIDPDNSQARIYAELIGTAEQHREYEEYFWRVDKWCEIAHRAPAGAAWLSHELASDSEFEESEFYRDFLRRWDGELFYLVGGCFARHGRLEAASAAMRSKKRGPFGQDDLRLMRLLMPHLRQAFALHARLVGLERERDTLASVLRQAPFGAIVLDRRARILLANRAAEQLLAEGDALRLEMGGLRATHLASDRTLQRLIHEAIALRSAAGGSLALPRRSGKRPLGLLVAPAPPDEARLSARSPAAILLVSDPDAAPDAAARALARLYRLTAMETRVAALLAEGRGIPHAADALALSRHTVQAHLKAIYAKTGLHSQAQLARLVGSLASLDRQEI